MKKKTAKSAPVKKVKRDIFHEKSVTFIDLGCGENKRQGCLGVDFRDAPGVDIVQNLTMYPWTAIPDEVANVVYTSHLLEHINPDSPDPRLAGLVDLLLQKKVVTRKEIEKNVGDYRFLGGFVRFMDEVWRITKPGGQFISTFPFAGSPGYWQDPTHVNPITHVTMAYFDPLAKDQAGNLYHLYTIYRSKPWKIVKCFYDTNGFMEIAMEKRLIDKSYKVSSDNGMKTK
jgi:SAM-dependent methyltransferase